MVCIYCASKTRVINSRPQIRQNTIWRRRECTSCHSIFTTFESFDLSKSLIVVSGGNNESFIKEKLLISLYSSLKHRDTALDDAQALTNTVINKIFKAIKTPSITSRQIAEIADKTLSNFDKPASVFYRSYYMKTN